MSAEGVLRGDPQSVWGSAGDQEHQTGCKTAVELLEVALRERPGHTADDPELATTIRECLPRWRRALGWWSGVPKYVKQDLRQLLRAARDFLR